jgi:hypothetical protein
MIKKNKRFLYLLIIMYFLLFTSFTFVLLSNSNETKGFDALDIVAWDTFTYRDIFEGNNLIQNGNFDNDDMHFNTHNSSNELIITDNQLLIYQNGLERLLPYYRSWNGTDYVGFYQSHTYYLQYDFKINYDINRIENYVRTEPPLGLNFDVIDSRNYSTYVRYFYLDNEVHYESEYLRFEPKYDYVDYNLIMYLDNIYLYDLTEIFDGTTIPSEDQFSRMLTYYNENLDSHVFDDTVSDINPLTIFDKIFEMVTKEDGFLGVALDFLYTPIQIGLPSSGLFNFSSDFSLTITPMTILAGNMLYTLMALALIKRFIPLA